MCVTCAVDLWCPWVYDSRETATEEVNAQGAQSFRTLKVLKCTYVIRAVRAEHPRCEM
jgi:hypothetical protein